MQVVVRRSVISNLSIANAVRSRQSNLVVITFVTIPIVTIIMERTIDPQPSPRDRANPFVWHRSLIKRQCEPIVPREVSKRNENLVRTELPQSLRLERDIDDMIFRTQRAQTVVHLRGRHVLALRFHVVHDVPPGALDLVDVGSFRPVRGR